MHEYKSYVKPTKTNLKYLLAVRLRQQNANKFKQKNVHWYKIIHNNNQSEVVQDRVHLVQAISFFRS